MIALRIKLKSHTGKQMGPRKVGIGGYGKGICKMSCSAWELASQCQAGSVQQKRVAEENRMHMGTPEEAQDIYFIQLSGKILYKK